MTTALIEASTGHTVSHAELKALGVQFSAILQGSKKLVLISTSNHIRVIAAMHGSQQAGHAILLYDTNASANYFQKLITLYQPEFLVLSNTNFTSKDYKLLTQIEGLSIFLRVTVSGAGIHPNLAFLLTTSGSTGSAKFVRLSYKNIETNTADIIQALNIMSHDRAAAHMPLTYSYGLSVVNTHLAAGASAVLLDDSMTSNNFWKSLREYKVTSLPGVPYHFALMHRLGLDRLNIPDVNTLTQAGGRMEPKLVSRFGEIMQQRNGHFFVMYGQTEASPRMTILSVNQVLDKMGSVGLPLQHGKIVIEGNEVIYLGPNVMMGYAENRSDLQRGDDMQGRLATGDFGYLDQDGYLYLTGRKSRFTKIDGLRVSLDEIEALADHIATTVAIEKNEQLILFTTGNVSDVRNHVLKNINLHASRVICQMVAVLPRLSNGKIDMSVLQELVL